jgi:hypothetical protein
MAKSSTKTQIEQLPPANPTKAATDQQDISNFSGFSGGPIHLCYVCSRLPRLGALSRCAACLRLAADADRRDRTEAEARVTARTDRQAALEKLGDAIIAFAGSPEGHRFLEAQQAELVAPRNDPEYVATLQGRDKDREVVANEITHIHHAVVWNRSRIGLTLRDDRDHAKAREVAAKLQQLFEAELHYDEDPHEKTNFADRRQKQPPKHEFGREKRSLVRRPSDAKKSKGAGSNV